MKSFLRFRFAALAGLVAASAVLSPLAANADDRRAALFEPCRACHALDPEERGLPGPHLAGLLGRRIGGDAQFDYSPVLRRAAAEGAVWTREKLDTFLIDPEAMFPGMWMSSIPFPDRADRRALVDFLADPESR